MSDSICCICLDPLSSPIMAMTPCGHCFHMSCIQQWADAAADLMDEDDDEDDEDPASRLCCPFCRKQSKHKMRLFLELPPPFVLQDEEDEEEEVPREESEGKEQDSVVPQDERKMPATRSATAKEKSAIDSPSSSRSGRKRSHDQQDNNNMKPSKVRKNDDPMMVKLTKENQVLKKRVRQLQNKLVLQSRKHLAHERQQVDEMENLMSVASETKKNLVTEQRRVRKCMMALEKFRDVDNGLQALVSRAFSEKEEAACNLAKLAEMHEAICSKLQLRKPPPRMAKGTATAAASNTSSSSNNSGTVKEKKVLTHWFKRYELESIQKTLEEIHQLFDGDSDDDEEDDDDRKPNASTTQRRITRSLSRQQEQQM